MPIYSNKLSECPNIRHGFFGRQGGVSKGLYASLNCGLGSQDDPQAVKTNRQYVVDELGARELVTLAQIHSSNVVVISQHERDIQGDALVTNQAGVALGVLTADCGPVLLADANAGVVGAAHAGWKGAFGSVLENTIEAMETLGANREQIVAAIGPTIAQASYEVGEAFVESRLKQDSTAKAFFTQDHYFNLAGYIEHRLKQSGLQRIEDLAIDTYANEQDYFSYRRTTHRSEPDYGRQVSCIMMKK